MEFRTILVPTAQHVLMNSTLEIALLVARMFDSYIEGCSSCGGSRASPQNATTVPLRSLYMMTMMLPSFGASLIGRHGATTISSSERQLDHHPDEQYERGGERHTHDKHDRQLDRAHRTLLSHLQNTLFRRRPAKKA
jgi:hypothetical protein